MPSNSVSLITSAQSFHWFKGAETKKEFRRILSGRGYIALIWNIRDFSQPIQNSLNEILDKYALDYKTQAHADVNDAEIHQFFEPATVATWEEPYNQQFTLTEFIARLKSASYFPKKGVKELDNLELELTNLHLRHRVDGLITFPYRTRLFIAAVEPEL